MYYKHVTIINDDSNIVNKFEASLTDDARVAIYNLHMFVIQATSQEEVVAALTNLFAILPLDKHY